MSTEQPQLEAAGARAQEFELRGAALVRRLQLDPTIVESSVNLSPAETHEASDDPLGAWWSAFLRGERPISSAAADAPLRVIDLFSGTGGLSVGARQAAGELGQRAVIELAVDSDADALASLAANHDLRLRRAESITGLVDYRIQGSSGDAAFSYRPEIIDDEAAQAAERASLLVAGPPCQGHSNLNNRSRRVDLRNHLMLIAPAFAAAAGVPYVVIENVPEVMHDYSDVVDITVALLRSSGYEVVQGVLRADAMGWPQTRRRYFIVASREHSPIPLESISACLRSDMPRSVDWILKRLSQFNVAEDDPLNAATAHNERTQARIDWLFDNDTYELANTERPASHRNGTTYGSVYGRMRPDAPAPTITTGFTTPGRGRFVHPHERRTLTPREAALIQGFPLNYRFTTVSGRKPYRNQLAKWIGDAVPMPLGYAAVMSVLASAP